MDIGVEEIRRWHVEERRWADIGYHYVIRRNGHIEEGRPLEKAGAHTHGHNKDSIGICLVGGLDEDNQPDANFTAEQYNSLLFLIEKLWDDYGKLAVYGHRDFNKTKVCPCFDVHGFLERNL